MSYEVEISPEVVKMAQRRARSLGTTLSDELARHIAQESILSADLEAELLLDDEHSYSSSDALAAAFGLNDIVVNGVRLDVRALDEQGRVGVSRLLIGTSYLNAGTLVVQMRDSLHGKVVSFVSAEQWAAAAGAGNDGTVFVQPQLYSTIDFQKFVTSKPTMTVSGASRAPSPFDLANFLAKRNEMPAAKQKAILEGTLANQAIWGEIEAVVATWCQGNVRQVVTDSGVWNRRINRVVDVVAPKFKSVSRDEVRRIISQIGEKEGGQPESPAFRKALLTTLTREELSRRLGGATLKKAATVAEAVLSGRAVADAIKDASRSEVAVQIASQIKRQRQKLSTFADATAQELAAAFQQLALQPAYATHSNDPGSSMESINDALKLLDAAELAEEAEALNRELAKL